MQSRCVGGDSSFINANHVYFHAAAVTGSELWGNYTVDPSSPSFQSIGPRTP